MTLPPTSPPATDRPPGPPTGPSTGRTDTPAGESASDFRLRLRPGARVRVIQQIAARHYAWQTQHAGTVVRYEQKQTGSWFAHSRGEKLWLDRLVIRKDDGEIFTFNLDDYTHLDVLADAPDSASAASNRAAPGEATPGTDTPAA